MEITREQADAIGRRVAGMWRCARDCDALEGREFEERAYRWRLRACEATMTLETLDIPCHFESETSTLKVGNWTYRV